MALILGQFGLVRLRPDERVEILELLWDSTPDDGYIPPQWHIEILKQRLNNPRPDDMISWDEFKTRWLQ